jgi:hypothetical protein
MSAIAGRLAADATLWMFRLSRGPMPYRRRQGTVAGSLPHADRPSGVLETAIRADGWREREGAIVAAAGGLLAVRR